MVQERLIGLMHQNSEPLFVVSDDEQAIYGWRGADVINIMEFDKRYPQTSSHFPLRFSRLLSSTQTRLNAHLRTCNVPTCPSPCST